MGLLRVSAGLLILLQLVSACDLRRRVPDELGDDLGRKSLRRAVTQSLQYLARLPSQRVLGVWPREITAAELESSLLEFRDALDRTEPDSKVRWLARIAERFEFHAAPVPAGGDEPLFTGYYQPMVAASLVETDSYRFPLYAVPGGGSATGDLSGLSRRDIDTLGMLAGGGHEIAWLKDPVDRFFLHIQGSGLLELRDGRRLYLNFAATNGRPYTSIGKVLIDTGKLERASLSMQRIRQYLAEHPAEMDDLFAMNERYVFFRLGDRGPLGSLGVPLTAGRSIATDARVYPPGALAYIETELPVMDDEERVVGWRPVRRFVMNQDAGAAIRGVDRVDLYFGSGRAAGQAAGVMQRRGRLYFLLRRPESDSQN